MIADLIRALYILVESLVTHIGGVTLALNYFCCWLTRYASNPIELIIELIIEVHGEYLHRVPILHSLAVVAT